MCRFGLSAVGILVTLFGRMEVKCELSYKVRQAANVELNDYCPTKVTTMGNVIETVSLRKQPMPPPIQKLSKELYLDLRTGEVGEFEHSETRADDKNSVRRTLSRIRALINTNCTEPENVRWVTLTYAENMTDTKQLYKDYVSFWKRFCRWCNSQGYSKPEYITVQEPQGRGAWHIHAFFIFPHKAPFIDNNSVMWKLWGHGFTSTKQLHDCDNAGAYFSAYLADMPLDEYVQLDAAERDSDFSGSSVVEKEFVDADDQRKMKKFVKGGRLGLYPAGMQIYRKSKGIKEPEVEQMTLKEAKKKVSAATLTFSSSYEVVDDDGNVHNAISKSYYNRAR